MRIVLDSNVLMSGIFFGGTPGQILNAWKDGEVVFVLSPSILEEYRRVGDELESKYGDFGLSSILAVLVANSEMIDAPDLEEGVARDPDDDKFLACAAAAEVAVIVSGDSDLQSIGTWKGVRILSPRIFVDEYLDVGAS